MEFQNEVIGKHPVIKHLKFGSLLSFESVWLIYIIMEGN
jgi:hypothetical protein